MNATLTLDPAIADLNRKIDALTEQVAFLTAEARTQQARRQEWDELKDDMTPIFNDVYRISVEQLEEIEQNVQIEDILFLFKRLLRSTRALEQMLDQLESGMELVQDISPLSQDVFLSLMNQLNELEQKGYFTFIQGGMNIIDKIVTAFGEDDIEQLGDNIVLILQTVKDMTQPEIMNFVRDTVEAVEEDEPVDPSMFSIIKQLNDPAVKRGLAKTLNVLKSMSEVKPGNGQ